MTIQFERIKMYSFDARSMNELLMHGRALQINMITVEVIFYAFSEKRSRRNNSTNLIPTTLIRVVEQLFSSYGHFSSLIFLIFSCFLRILANPPLVYIYYLFV